MCNLNTRCGLAIEMYQLVKQDADLSIGEREPIAPESIGGFVNAITCSSCRCGRNVPEQRTEHDQGCALNVPAYGEGWVAPAMMVFSDYC